MKKAFKETALLFKRIRKDQGLTQAEVAQKYKIHIQVVSNYERGICLPPMPTLRKIYKAMSTEDQSMFDDLVSIDRHREFKKKLGVR